MPTRDENIAHFSRLDKYSASIDDIYKQAIAEAARLINLATYNPDKPFTFDDYPLAKIRIKKIIGRLSRDMQAFILKSIEQEWNFSNAENDALVRRVFPKLTDAQLSVFMARNVRALASFQDRKAGKFKLSERVWNLSDQFRTEVEMCIDLGLADGRSAAQLSRDIRQYLNEPDKLFRRVRDKNGKLRPSQNMLNYHPGQGVYRSSYKNAMRVTRSEVNMAYRMADHERSQSLPFIGGFEVFTSNNHPVTDICDDLKGRYPKDFVFIGWHPHCRCHKRSILASKDELSQMTDAILNGDDPVNVKVSKTVKGVPGGMNSWYSQNRDRVAGWKSKPYFMNDNPGYF